ncbi:MAG: metal ABC transporter permease [Bdellovibrionales bacterium]|jgi:zinc/manganese transport system permease protein
MSLADVLVSPFTDYAFMKRALVAAMALAISGTPLGVLMMLRRMTLVGDALSHAILPGIAVAFFVAGLSLWAMTLGGVIAALIVAGLAAFLSRLTDLKEDAAFALLYLLSLAVGVALISIKGGSAHLMHVLFGNILAIDQDTLMLVTGVCCLSLFTIAALYRRFVIDGFDGAFMRTAGAQRRGVGLMGLVFFALLMINLVASFQAMGTLMALGLMVLPALAAHFWAKTIDGMMPLAMGLGAVAAYAGLVLSYHTAIPSGPAIVLVAGGMTVVSAVLGRFGSVVACVGRKN